MTEEEWLGQAEVGPLLEFIAGRISPRKARLFACACCRRIGDLPGNQWCYPVIEIVERFVDGSATGKEVETAELEQLRSIDAIRDRHPYPDYLVRPEHAARWAARWLSLRERGAGAIGGVATEVAQAFGLQALATFGQRSGLRDVLHTAEAREREHQCRLLRDIVGNPFQPVAVEPPWLAWRDGTVPKVAETIYQERAFDRLPILGDALEDAGCAKEDVLRHCREPGEHVRGCWVVDLLTGRR
jgi:hypothetical protein